MGSVCLAAGVGFVGSGMALNPNALGAGGFAARLSGCALSPSGLSLSVPILFPPCKASPCTAHSVCEPGNGKPREAARREAGVPPPCGKARFTRGQCWPVASKGRGVFSLPVALILYLVSPMPFQNCSRCSSLRPGLSRHKAVRVVAALPTHFLFHVPWLRSAPRLHFFHGMGLTR